MNEDSCGTAAITLPTVAAIADPTTGDTPNPGPATLTWHPPHSGSAGMVHRTVLAHHSNPGSDTLSWCRWSFGDTDGTCYPELYHRFYLEQLWQHFLSLLRWYPPLAEKKIYGDVVYTPGISPTNCLPSSEAVNSSANLAAETEVL